MFQVMIDEMTKELAFYKAMQEDYCVKKIPVINILTSAVYEQFCQRHPEVHVTQQRFSRALCDKLKLKSKQSWLEGQRGCFYEYR